MAISQVNGGASDGGAYKTLYNKVKGNEEQFFIEFKHANKTENDSEVFDAFGKLLEIDKNHDGEIDDIEASFAEESAKIPEENVQERIALRTRYNQAVMQRNAQSFIAASINGSEQQENFAEKTEQPQPTVSGLKDECLNILTKVSSLSNALDFDIIKDDMPLAQEIKDCIAQRNNSFEALQKIIRNEDGLSYQDILQNISRLSEQIKELETTAEKIYNEFKEVMLQQEIDKMQESME